jgi:hypothetical protein
VYTDTTLDLAYIDGLSVLNRLLILHLVWFYWVHWLLFDLLGLILLFVSTWFWYVNCFGYWILSNLIYLEFICFALPQHKIQD